MSAHRDGIDALGVPTAAPPPESAPPPARGEDAPPPAPARRLLDVARAIVRELRDRDLAAEVLDGVRGVEVDVRRPRRKPILLCLRGGRA